MANITGIVLPYFRLCLLIVHSAAPDLNSTNEGPIAPITPFPSGEETIWPAYKLSDMDGKAGPEMKEIRVIVKIFLMYILHNVTTNFKKLSYIMICWNWLLTIRKFLPDSHWFDFDGSSISTEFVGPASPKPPATTIFTAPESW